MVVIGCAWAVSKIPLCHMTYTNLRNANDVGLMLALHAITRIIQTFPRIEPPPGWPWEEPGEERQHPPLALANGVNSCKLILS